MKMITQLHLVLSIRMRGTMSSLPHVPSWYAWGQFYIINSKSLYNLS
jgi:hypothetical protein